MTTRHCRHRRPPVNGGSALAMSGLRFYSREAKESRGQSPLEVVEEDNVRLSALSGSNIKSYADLGEAEMTRARIEQRMENYNAPFTRELDSIFDDLDLPPLPPPLPKAIWEFDRAPWRTVINEEVKPFTSACEDGALDTIEHWVTEKRDLLGQIGLQHGLAQAAWKDRTNIVDFLLSKGGAYLDSAVIEMACRNHSIPMFEVAIKHGYHPNQQMPSRAGYLSTALNECLHNFDVTEFLLLKGADPDLGRWQDTRRQPWKDVRTAPAMDRQCGIALDQAVGRGDLALAELLLKHGAHINYSRPIHKLISRRICDGDDKEWRPFMDLFFRFDVDVNAKKAWVNSPDLVLHYAVYMGQWGIVEELLIRGADPHIKSRPDRKDAFQIALDREARSSKNDARVFQEIFERVEARKISHGARQ